MRRRLERALNVDDVRALARRRLPRGLFEYVDRGTGDEIAMRDTRRALDAVKLVPSVLQDVGSRDPGTEIFNRPQKLPLVIAPTAVAGLVWHDGEVHLARAAAKAGIPFCVSTQSITTVERIAHAGAEIWFQLYVWRDRAMTWDLIERARGAGATTLVLTADTPIGPKREYNTRNGFGIPLKPSLRAGIDILLHPVWLGSVLLRYLRTEGMPTYAHYPPEFRTAIGRIAIGDRLNLADTVTWEDLRELRRRWPGRLVVKGILDVSDAERARACGADGIVVSNHGARNLDASPAPIDVLPDIAERVGRDLTIMADSGVRRGTDVVKLIASGAQAVLIGRSVLYGMAAAGEAGALRVLDILRGEIADTMALTGKGTIAACRFDLPVRRDRTAA